MFGFFAIKCFDDLEFCTKKKKKWLTPSSCLSDAVLLSSPARFVTGLRSRDSLLVWGQTLCPCSRGRGVAGRRIVYCRGIFSCVTCCAGPSFGQLTVLVLLAVQDEAWIDLNIVLLFLLGSFGVERMLEGSILRSNDHCAPLYDGGCVWSRLKHV